MARSPGDDAVIRDQEASGTARLLSDEIVSAASSPGRGLKVSQLSRQGSRWKEPIDLQIQLQVDRDAGGSLAVLISEPYQGPSAPDTMFRLDPSDPTTIEAMAVELRRMFAAWHADPESPWRFEQENPDASDPVDEDWQARPTASDLLDRLGRVRSGRGGVVAVAAIDHPLTVIRLSVSGPPSNMRVTGRVEPLLGEPSKVVSAHRWSVRGNQPEAVRLLRDASALLADVTQRDDPSPGAGLAVRLETSSASKRASRAGCVPLIMVAVFTVSIGMGLFYLGWPQSGIIADLAGRAGEGATNDPRGGVAIVTVALASGVVPAWFAMKGVEWIADRRRFRYTIEGSVLTVVGVGVYAVWVAAVMLTPGWSVLVGIVMVPLVALVGVVLAAAWLQKWRRARKPR